MSDTLNIKPGDAMPPFSLTAQNPDGTTELIDSTALLGHPFVLFFYPEADTPGCTKESIRFTELLPQFAALGARVFGGSHNTPSEQYDFACKFSLAMPLLSDPEWTYRKLLGNPDGSEPVARITYVVDAEGIVREVIGVPRIEADEHPQVALDSLTALQTT